MPRFRRRLDRRVSPYHDTFPSPLRATQPVQPCLGERLRRSPRRPKPAPAEKKPYRLMVRTIRRSAEWTRLAGTSLIAGTLTRA